MDALLEILANNIKFLGMRVGNLERLEKPSGSSGSGDVVGPAGAVNGNLAVFNGITGKLIKDGGAVPSGNVVGPVSAVNGNLALFDGTTGKLVKDGGAVPTGNVVGPGSAVDGNLAVYDGTTGKLVKDGGLIPVGGIWTPGLVNTTNISASTAYEGQYIRVGNIVHCSVAVSITPTATGACELRIDPPIVPASNFADAYAGSGVGAVFAISLSGAVNSTGATKKMRFRFLAPDTTAREWRLTFSYKLS